MVTGILRCPAISPDMNSVDVQATSIDVDTNPPVAATCAHGLHNWFPALLSRCRPNWPDV